MKLSLRKSLKLHQEAFKKLYRKFRFFLIHVHARIEYAVAARLAARKVIRDIPMVFIVHGYPDTASYLISGIIANRLIDEVICVSEAERRKARAYGWPEEKLSVIYNGVPTPEIPGSSDRIKAS